MAETANEGGEGGKLAPEPTPAAPAAGKTFTQDEMNAIIQDRLARAAKGQPTKDELAELQKAKAKLEEIETAGTTELEKAQKAKEAAEAKADAVLKTANERLIRAALLLEMREQGVVKADVLASTVDHGSLTVGDDGEVSGVKEAVTAFVTENPEFVGKGTEGGGSADQGARGGGPDEITREQLAKMSPPEVQKALRAGKLNHLTRG